MTGSTKTTQRLSGSAATSVALLFVAGALAAQTPIDEFTYDNLRASAIQIDLGPLVATDLNSTVAGGLRLDFGRIGPRVRVLLGLSYYATQFSDAAVQEFEDGLDSIVNPGVPDSIVVGRVELKEVVADLDLQYVLSDSRSATIYAGLGVSVHFANGSGSAINGTFVEDALDGIGAGANATIGSEFKVGGPWRVTLDLRGVLSSDVSTASLRAGVMYRFGGTP